MEKLKEEAIKLTRETGVDLVGVAPAERFSGAPEGHRPGDLLQGTQSVISFAVRIPMGTLLTAPNFSFLQFGWLRLNEILNLTAHRLAILLEDRGFISMPMPAARDFGSPEIVRVEPEPEIHYMGSFSERHAAELAGLGRIGLSGCVITKEFGSHVRLGSVLTTAALPPDPLTEEELCLPDKCGYLCVRLCPWDAISEEGSLSHFRCAAARSGHDIGHYQRLSTLPDLLASSKAMAYTDTGPTTCAICQIRCPTDPRFTPLPKKLKEKTLLASNPASYQPNHSDGK
jgi:epoxyqueuosine reductase QueG